MTSRALPTAALAAALLFAAGIRFAGADWGLPWAFHIDERLFVVAKSIQLEESLGAGGLPDPGISSYGILPLWLLVIARKIGLPFVTGHVDAVHGSTFAGTVLLARWISALWGTAAVLLAAALGRRFGRGTSLAAAVMVAGFPALVQIGHFGTVEAPLVALILAGLLAAERLAERTTPGRLAGAGVVLGLALSVKAPGGVIVLPMLHALLAGDRRRFLPRAVALCGTAALVVMALHPSMLFSTGVAGGEHTTLSGNLRRAFSPDFRDWTLPYAHDIPVFTELTKLMPYAMGPLPELFALLGLVAVVRRRSPRDVRLLLALAPLLLLLLAARVKTVRFLVPALPMLAVLAAEGARFAFARRERIVPAALAVLAVLTAVHGAAYVPVWTSPDTRIAAARWLDEHVGPRDIVVVEDPPGYGPPIGTPVPSMERPVLRWDILWRGFYLVHERATEEERRAHLESMLKRADWLVLSEGHRREFTTAPELRPVESAFYADLDAGRLPFRLEREFRSGPRLGPIHLPDEGAEVLFRTFDHPTIQVWKRTP